MYKQSTVRVLVALLYEYRTAVGTSTETMNHIFQKNAIEFETGITRHETIRYDSVCDVIYFRKLIDTFDCNPWFFILTLFWIPVLYATVLILTDGLRKYVGK